MALLVPVGRWAADEFAFGASGDAVEQQLGDDAALVDSMLLVRSVGCGGRISTGSAFVVDLAGEPTIVTNRHVVAEARSITLRPLTGGPVTLVARHRTAGDADVAVLELGEGTTLPTPLRAGGRVDVGAEVRVVGFPSGRPSTGTGSVVEVAPGRLVVDAPVSGGASGSPVLDGDGRVVGQVFATTRGGNGVATPIATVARAAQGAQEPEGC